jgi:TonB family protein
MTVVRIALPIALFACSAPAPQPIPCPPQSASSQTDSTVYDTTAVNPKPKVISSPKPEYPPDLQMSGIGGQVWFEYVIDQSGLVERNAFRVISSTDPRFTTAATPSVLGAHFCPGLVQGVPVRTRVRSSVTFRIGGD